ncbi:MAG: hypothetical protein HC906_06440 [Bacteroidales bacterium]|nr:hypothetical protein [Bacteroidales bacterium]
MFQHYRYGLNAYRIDAPDGLYEIELLFIDALPETEFEVFLNDEKIYHYTTVPGNEYAISIKSVKEIKNNEGIHILFKKVQGGPVLSGIQVQKK